MDRVRPWIGRTASLLRTMAFNEFPLQRVGSSAHCPDRPDESEKKEVAEKKEKKKKKLREVTFDRWSVKMVSADFVESRAVTCVLCIRRYLGSGRERNGGKKKRRQERVSHTGGFILPPARRDLSHRVLHPPRVLPTSQSGGVAILAKTSIENGNPPRN